MNESAFEAVENYSKILKLDFGSAGFARLAQELDFSSEAVNAVAEVFRRLSERKTETTINTILKMSRLPLKDPKTFENFDFSLIKGRDVERLKSLPAFCGAQRP